MRGRGLADHLIYTWPLSYFLCLEQIIKCVYGFLLGIITNPIIAMLALGSQAEHNLLVQRIAEKEKEKNAEESSDSEPQAVLATITEIPPTPLHLQRPSMPMTPSSRISRLRSGSYASSIRQSGFTVDVSDIPVDSPIRLAPPLALPATPMAPTMMERSGPPQVQTPGSVVPRRPRALTGASEAGSYYSLGGTGGRAQRGRRPSVLSVQQVGVPGTPMASNQNQNQNQNQAQTQDQDRDRSGTGARQRTMTESTISPIRQIPQAWMSTGTGAMTGTGTGRAEDPDSVETLTLPPTPYRQHTGMSRLMAESKLDAPRESMEIRAEGVEGDVFGGDSRSGGDK